jgi:DUF1365 family protein
MMREPMVIEDLPAASLYVGKVMHQRMKPRTHRFTYRVFNLAVDLDRLDEADRLSRLFSVNGRNIVSFHEADHWDGAGYGSLRAYADRLLDGAELKERAARILLVCYPRILGRVFNPIAIYYAYDGTGRLVALIYEVRNTFGERHTYVCAIQPGESSPAGIRQSRAKVFYVSPFIEMEMRYHFRMLPPGEDIRWRILETDREGPLLSATFSGSRCPLDTPSLAKCLLHIPFQTWKIVGGIHFEALRLWLKGIRLVKRGTPPATVSYEDEPGLRTEHRPAAAGPLEPAMMRRSA